MADLNYVSPLTSDLTDYYTKTEVDELQQGDENRFATQAQITAGDNEVKGWVASQGYLTQHQSLQNYATKDYVNDAIEDIEVEGGVKIRVVSNLPANPETNVIYLTRRSSEEDDNVYNEWIYVEDIEDFELIGDTSTGVLPDLTDYATKSYVDTVVAGISVDAKDVSYDNDASGLEASNVKNAIDEVYAAIPTMPVLATVATSGDYDDLSNKPTIPSLTGYATTTYVDDAVAAIDIPDVSDFITAEDLPDVSDMATETWVSSQGYLTQHQDISGKANAADLAAVATTGSYNDLSNKPTIPSTSGLASETYVDDAIAAIKGSDIDNDMNWVDEPMAKAFAIDEINNNVSAAGLSGDYDDLINKPTIPDVSGKANSADLATVATSGSYNDLSNKPTIPDISSIPAENIRYNYPDLYPFYVNDVKQYLDMIIPGLRAKANTSSLATVATSGDYDDLTNKPTIPTVPTNVSSFTNDAGYLTSHQDISGKANSSDLATVATTGDYDDLTNKPTIPVLPTLATVATSGDYNDLSNKPNIPASGIPNAGNMPPFGLISAPRTCAVYGNTHTKADILRYLVSGHWVRYYSTPITIYTYDLPYIGTYSKISLCSFNGTTYKFDYSQVDNVQLEMNYIYAYYPSNVIIKIAFNDMDNVYKAFIYDNTTSGLTATTIQGAIDELAAASGSSSGITVQDVIDEFNDNGLTLDNETDNKVEITNSGIIQTVYDSNENVLVEQFLDSRTAYERGTEKGVDWEVQTYDTIDETGLGFGRTDLEDGEPINEMSLNIRPSKNYDAIEVEMSDTANGGETKTVAFQEDLPIPEWEYDENTFTLTLWGINQIEEEPEEEGL